MLKITQKVHLMYVLFIHYLQRQSRREVTINQLINQGGIPTKVLSTLHHESTINASPRKYDQLVYYIIITLTNFIYFAFTLIANNRPKICTLYVDSTNKVWIQKAHVLEIF